MKPGARPGAREEGQVLVFKWGFGAGCFILKVLLECLGLIELITCKGWDLEEIQR